MAEVKVSVYLAPDFFEITIEDYDWAALNAGDSIANIGGVPNVGIVVKKHIQMPGNTRSITAVRNTNADAPPSGA